MSEGSWWDYSPSEIVSSGLAQYVLGPATSVYANVGPRTETEVQAQADAARQAQQLGENYCDRSTIAGRLGYCEAAQVASNVGDILSSPALTLAAGAVAVGAGTLALVAIANVTGATPVLQATGRVAAAGIRSAGRAFGA